MSSLLRELGRNVLRLVPLLWGSALWAQPEAGGEAGASWHLAVQTYSWHEPGADEGIRNWTPGIGLIRRQGDWLAGAGVFRNSIGRYAGFGYVGWQKPIGRFRAGGIAGLTHNYRWNDGGVVPLAAAVVTVPVARDWSVELIGIPPIRHVSYATLNFTLAWRFR